MTRNKEILIGDLKLLDFLALDDSEDSRPHPLQEAVETAIAELPEDLQDVFYMRYGQHMTIRAIAKAQDYDGHQIIQYKLQKIEEAVREHLEAIHD